MVSLSWIDIHYLSREINTQLTNSKIENIYGSHEELHIKLYKSGLKNTFISTFLQKGVIIMSNEKYNHNAKNIFIQYLRKNLKNATFLESIIYEKERIISLKFEVKDIETKQLSTMYIHIELFMGGQVTLCDSEHTILRRLKTIPLEHQKEQTPTYQTPSLNSNVLNIELNSIDTSQTLQESLKFLGLGKKYIQYLSMLLQITPQSELNSLKESQITTLVKEISNLTSYSVQPTLLYSQINTSNKTSEKVLLPFNPKEFNSKIPHISIDVLENSFSSNLIQFHGTTFLPQIQEQKEPAKLTKLKKRLQEQEKNLQKITNESEKYELQAGVIYEEYQKLQELQAKINEIIKNEGFPVLKQKIKENPTLKKLITSINERDKTITLNTQVLKEI